MTTWMDGRALADEIAGTLKLRVDHLKRAGILPRLAILVVGNDERTASYIRAKSSVAERIGVDVVRFPFDAATEPSKLTREINEIIEQLNNDPSTHGIILQLPVPAGVDEDFLLNTIAPAKDVDGLTETNQAAVEMGRELLPPATPMGILRLLERYRVPIVDAPIAVIGQGRVVGKPMAEMLRSRGADVRTASMETTDLRALTKGATIVISATGQAGLITPDLLDDDVVLIDAG